MFTDINEFVKDHIFTENEFPNPVKIYLDVLLSLIEEHNLEVVIADHIEES